MLDFIMAILPLIVVFIGIIWLKKSGAVMAVVGWLLAVVLAVGYFSTSLEVAIGASIYGIIKALGISIAVVFTMYLIFLMKEVGALDIISEAIKRVARTKEEQALFIGIAFGSFVTSLGVVTPALFPPLLMAMGFSPISSVAIAVLGYNATTSFALLSIPVTLPAEVFNIDVYQLAYKITIFLPVISTLISFALLWVIGGKDSVKKGFVPSIILGLTLGFSALGLVIVRAPIMVIGVLAGLISMGVLYVYGKWDNRNLEKDSSEEPIDRKELIRALSPWLILIGLASVVSIPPINTFLAGLDGNGTVLSVAAYKNVDPDIFAQVYTCILASILLSLPVLKPNKEQLRKVTKLWSRRIWGPFVAYSLFFSISFVMAYSAMNISNGALSPTSAFPAHNMNYIVGSALASVFGAGYIFVAASLGLFGAVVGGSETGSNVMFFPIQHQACSNIGLSDKGIMTVYGAHANAGGVASAITPSKINNAVATIDADSSMESEIMKKHAALVVLITIVIGIMTGIFVALGV